MMPFAAVLPTGGLLPESIPHSDSFKILATFVALNTLMYATLAVLKVLPKGYSFFGFNGRNRRMQNRSIYLEPTGPEPFDNRDHLSGPGDDLLVEDLDAPLRLIVNRGFAPTRPAEPAAPGAHDAKTATGPGPAPASSDSPPPLCDDPAGISDLVTRPQPPSFATVHQHQDEDFDEQP